MNKDDVSTPLRVIFALEDEANRLVPRAQLLRLALEHDERDVVFHAATDLADAVDEFRAAWKRAVGKITKDRDENDREGTP